MYVRNLLCFQLHTVHPKKGIVRKLIIHRKELLRKKADISIFH